MDIEFIRSIGLVILVFMGISLLLALILFFVVVRQTRRIDVPPGSGFAETLLYTPFLVVVFIDLLDFGLDILAAPFSWVVLDRLGLKALRGVSAVEALLPFTQFIPTMTLCWVMARILGPSKMSMLEQGR